jgi:hypothetical protein
MARYQKILVAFDGSVSDENALRQALRLACDEKCWVRVVALAVVDLPEEVYAVSPEAVDRLLARAQGHAAAVAAVAAKAGVPCSIEVREGAPAAKIVEIAREAGAGVVVMGSHGRTGLARLLMGSVTEKVIGHAPCPVLVVR